MAGMRWREISIPAVAGIAVWLACDREISIPAVARMAVWLACVGEISIAAVARMARIAAGLKVFMAYPIYIVLFEISRCYYR